MTDKFFISSHAQSFSTLISNIIVSLHTGSHIPWELNTIGEAEYNENLFLDILNKNTPFNPDYHELIVDYPNFKHIIILFDSIEEYYQIETGVFYQFMIHRKSNDHYYWSDYIEMSDAGLILKNLDDLSKLDINQIATLINYHKKIKFSDPAVLEYYSPTLVDLPDIIKNHITYIKYSDIINDQTKVISICEQLTGQKAPASLIRNYRDSITVKKEFYEMFSSQIIKIINEQI